MPISAQLQAVFAGIKQEESVHTPLTIQALRSAAVSSLEYAGEPAAILTQDVFVTARDGHQLKIRIFNPTIGISPVLFFYPGCGYVTDSFALNSIACSRIANFAGIKVILMSHRLAPEFPLPIPMYDGYDVAKFLTEQAEQFQIDKKQIFIGGVSSGAHCALVIANLAAQEQSIPIAQQVLLNGLYDMTQSQHGYDEFEKVDILTPRSAANFIIQQYQLKPEQMLEPLFSPLFSTLAHLPPTTILVAEYDGVRNDSEALYKKLLRAGNPVEKIILPGQTHDGIFIRGLVSDVVDPAKVIAEVIKKNIAAYAS